MKFKTGDSVYKHGAGYAGPGEIVVGFLATDGHPRYVVSHHISDGRGEFFHIYGEAQLSAFGPRATFDLEGRVAGLEQELAALRGEHDKILAACADAGIGFNPIADGDGAWHYETITTKDSDNAKEVQDHDHV